MNLHLESWTSVEKMEQIFYGIQCCSWNFIFIEDSDDASNHQIEMLAYMLSHIRKNSSCHYHKVVVMLTSTYGSRELARLLYDEIENTGSRTTLTNTRLQETANQVTSPLINSLLLAKVPFTPVPYLPLGKREVEHCILHDFAAKKQQASQEVIDNILSHLRFEPSRLEYFSVSGCKRVSTQVNVYVEF